MVSTATRLESDSASQIAATAPARSDVLFVDLDGTLIRTDLLSEAAVALFKASPWRLIATLGKLASGRAALKQAVSQAVTIETRRLPLHEEALTFLVSERAQGRRLVMATASDATWARVVADELGMFDDVLASDGTHNLKGAHKLRAIEAYCAEHGYAGFDYLGDSRADLPIWRAARRACVVEPSSGLLRQVRAFSSPTVVGTRHGELAPLLKALRPHQWVKNTLLFVPLIMSHNVLNVGMLLATAVAFVCFCLSASAAYILNDMTDVGADRRHPTKRKRPFASGDLPISYGPPIAAGLVAVAFAISGTVLPVGFTVALAVYFLATCAYSAFAKPFVIVDVQFLAALYTLRVFAGGLATGIVVSEWLMAFSLFLFVSLAFAKRYAELDKLLRRDELEAHGRGYRVADISLIESMGLASGYIAVLVLALYVNDESTSLLYRTPWYLWLICPLLMYWINRIWLKATRGELPEDPIVFALRDRVSLYLGVAVSGLLLAAALAGS